MIRASSRPKCKIVFVLDVSSVTDTDTSKSHNQPAIRHSDEEATTQLDACSSIVSLFFHISRLCQLLVTSSVDLGSGEGIRTRFTRETTHARQPSTKIAVDDVEVGLKLFWGLRATSSPFVPFSMSQQLFSDMASRVVQFRKETQPTTTKTKNVSSVTLSQDEAVFRAVTESLADFTWQPTSLVASDILQFLFVFTDIPRRKRGNQGTTSLSSLFSNSRLHALLDQSREKSVSLQWVDMSCYVSPQLHSLRKLLTSQSTIPVSQITNNSAAGVSGISKTSVSVWSSDSIIASFFLLSSFISQHEGITKPFFLPQLLSSSFQTPFWSGYLIDNNEGKRKVNKRNVKVPIVATLSRSPLCFLHMFAIPTEETLISHTSLPKTGYLVIIRSLSLHSFASSWLGSSSRFVCIASPFAPNLTSSPLSRKDATSWIGNVAFLHLLRELSDTSCGILVENVNTTTKEVSLFFLLPLTVSTAIMYLLPNSAYDIYHSSSVDNTCAVSASLPPFDSSTSPPSLETLSKWDYCTFPAGSRATPMLGLRQEEHLHEKVDASNLTEDKEINIWKSLLHSIHPHEGVSDKKYEDSMINRDFLARRQMRDNSMLNMLDAKPAHDIPSLLFSDKLVPSIHHITTESSSQQSISRQEPQGQSEESFVSLDRKLCSRYYDLLCNESFTSDQQSNDLPDFVSLTETITNEVRNHQEEDNDKSISATASLDIDASALDITIKHISSQYQRYVNENAILLEDILLEDLPKARMSLSKLLYMKSVSQLHSAISSFIENHLLKSPQTLSKQYQQKEKKDIREREYKIQILLHFVLCGLVRNLSLKSSSSSLITRHDPIPKKKKTTILSLLGTLSFMMDLHSNGLSEFLEKFLCVHFGKLFPKTISSIFEYFELLQPSGESDVTEEEENEDDITKRRLAFEKNLAGSFPATKISILDQNSSSSNVQRKLSSSLCHRPSVPAEKLSHFSLGLSNIPRLFVEVQRQRENKGQGVNHINSRSKSKMRGNRYATSNLLVNGSRKQKGRILESTRRRLFSDSGVSTEQTNAINTAGVVLRKRRRRRVGISMSSPRGVRLTSSRFNTAMSPLRILESPPAKKPRKRH